MTRRQNSSPEGRHIRHVVKLTQSEADVIHEHAQAAGVTPARYLVQTALGNAPTGDRQVVIDLLLGIRRQITGEATNLNQLARAANEDVWFESDIAAAAKVATATNTKLQELLERF
jgi:hypothetical protein